MLSLGGRYVATFLFCLGLGGFVIADCLTFPKPQGQGFGQGPGFYPQLLAGALLLLGALTLIEGLRAGRAPKRPRESGGRYALVAAVLGLSVLLMWFMRYLGFFLSGFLLSLISVALIRPSSRPKTWLADVVFSLGMILAVYLIFEVFIGIQLPRSILVG